VRQPKIKVLYLITKSNFGGAQRYVYDLATRLPRDRFEVAVALGGTGTRGAEGGVLMQMLEAAYIRTIFIKHFMREISLLNEFRAFVEILQMIRKERPRVLHLNSSKAAAMGAVAGRLLGIRKVIYTVHGWPFGETHRGIFFILMSLCGSWLTALLCHRVIFVSQRDKTSAHWMPFVQHKFNVIHIGIDTFDPIPKREARDRLASLVATTLPRDVIWIGGGTELTKNKGLSFGIEACAKLHEMGLEFLYLIAGEGEERKRLGYLIQTLGLERQVYLLGFVPDMRRLMKAFDIFLLPSLKEGLPYTLLEAGQAALPVVASSVGGIPEIIDHNKSGYLVKPGDAEDIARTLRALIEDSARRDTLGGALKRRVADEFDVSDVVNRTLQLYPTT